MAASIGEVVSASSWDPAYPADNVLREKGFWATTGCYPQEVVIKLDQTSKIEAISSVTMNVRQLRVLHSPGPAAANWKELASYEFDDIPGELQNFNQQVGEPGSGEKSRFLKFVVGSGWGESCTINRVSFE
ncbi:unnamed protein product [Chrysoparadoxa australica]